MFIPGGNGVTQVECFCPFVFSHFLISLAFSLSLEDESHLFLRSRLTMEDLESEKYTVHDPCVTWLDGKSLDTLKRGNEIEHV